MKKLLKGTLTGLLLVTLTTPGFAENREGAVTVSPFVGGYLLNKNQREESRPMFGLRAGYNFDKHFGVEAMFGYSLTETKRSLGTAGSKETDMYRYGIDLLYHFMPDSTFVPFVAVGGGGTNFKTPGITTLEESHKAGLVNYGLGLKYFVAPDVALRGDVRHVLIFSDIGHTNLEYSVGLTFQFGGVRKAAALIAEDEDTTKPTIVFTAPVNGATMMHVNQKTNVAFSEDMDTTTINAKTFTLQQGSTPVAGTVTANGSTATFTPAKNFEKGKTYTAIVTTGAKDLAGNALANNYMWEFNAGLAAVADTTAPTVTFTSPVKGATSAPVKQKVNAAFSENMDPATINSATFMVKQGSTPVAGKVSASASTATFSPAQDFVKGKSYTATVTTGARDLAGNALANNYVWDFKAYEAPKVLGVLATLENSHFDFNSAAISENGKTILNLNVKALKANPAMKLRIAGYTSAAGSEEYNQGLSEKRAEAVKEYLVKTGGISENRLATIGYGETNPAKYEANPSDKLSVEALANMRVVIEVIEE